MWSGKAVIVIAVCMALPVEVVGQRRVIKPEHSAAFHAFSISEWIGQVSGWGWISRDRIHGVLNSDGSDPGLDRGPLVFVRGIRWYTDWNGNALFRMPNWEVSDLDSVVLYEPGSIVSGFAAPDGAIDLYPKTTPRWAVSVSESNPSKDPGTLLATPHSSPNVERVGDRESFVIPLRLASYTAITRSDHILQNYLSTLDVRGRPFDDMVIRTTDPSRPDLWPWNFRRSITHMGTRTKDDRRLDVVMDVHRSREYYLWDDGVGSEVVFRDQGGRIGLSNRPVSGRGLRWAMGGAGTRYRPLMGVPSLARRTEYQVFMTVGYGTDRWEADLLMEGNRSGISLRWRHPRSWGMAAMLSEHTRLTQLVIPYGRWRATASVGYTESYQHGLMRRLHILAPHGFGLAHVRHGIGASETAMTRASWHDGRTWGPHRMDVQLATSLGPHVDQRFSRFVARAAWRWQATDTFGMALAGGYRSARRFEDALFPQVPGHTDISMNLHHRFFGDRALLELTMRNMLDRMDTDHPDGVIHPMAMEYRLRIVLP